MNALNFVAKLSEAANSSHASTANILLCCLPRMSLVWVHGRLFPEGDPIDVDLEQLLQEDSGPYDPERVREIMRPYAFTFKDHVPAGYVVPSDDTLASLEARRELHAHVHMHAILGPAQGIMHAEI